VQHGGSKLTNNNSELGIIIHTSERTVGHGQKCAGMPQGCMDVNGMSA